MAQFTQFHLDACPSNSTGLSEDCSCDKEAEHYLALAKWSFGLFLFEFLGGLFSGSIALVSDSLHVLLDGTENIVSAIVSKLSRKHQNEKKMRTIGGRISALLLLIAGGVIVHEGWERIITPHEVEWYMAAIATVGLLVNLLQMYLHQGVAKEHRNQTHFWQSRHLWSDIFASIAVIVGGLIMSVSGGLYWIDGVLSIGIGILIMILTCAKILGVEVHSHNHGHGHGDHAGHNHGPGCNHH